MPGECLVITSEKALASRVWSSCGFRHPLGFDPAGQGIAIGLWISSLSCGRGDLVPIILPPQMPGLCENPILTFSLIFRRNAVCKMSHIGSPLFFFFQSGKHSSLWYLVVMSLDLTSKSSICVCVCCLPCHLWHPAVIPFLGNVLIRARLSCRLNLLH